MRGISGQGVLARFVIAFALVALTWNPSRYNYYEWALAQWEAITPIVVLVGILLLIAWVVYLRATARSLGFLGIVLAMALSSTVLWILFYYDVVEATDSQLLGWIALLLLSAVLTAGMTWSHLRRAWSGQLDVDDVDER
jgi:hypothetical protein